MHDEHSSLGLLQYRPQYHIVPPFGSANDVQAVYRDGTYHVFYGYDRHFPPPRGLKCWGHVASEDLVHWRRLPVCLDPTPGSCDEDGCWTGCIVDNDGVPTAFYTGVKPQVQCMATSEDMIHWQKFSGNPVIEAPPKELADIEGFGNFRDPCVWREDDGWSMALGSGIPGRGSAVLIYRSRDLVDWEYLHPLFVGPTYDGDMYECPDLFPLGDKHVLIASTQIGGMGRVLYFVGSYRNHRFEPEVEGYCDYGQNFYAAKTLIDGTGRRVLWGWASDGWSRDLRCLAGWSGAYSVPRALSLGSDGHLCSEPVEEFQAARGRVLVQEASRDIGADTVWPLEGVHGCELEVEAELDVRDAREVGLLVRCAPEGGRLNEHTRIVYSGADHRLTLDCRNSSELYDANVTKRAQSAPLRVGRGDALRLRVFIDHSLVEVFANGRCCLTASIYPLMAESDGVALFANGGAATARRVDVWEIDGKAGIGA